MMINNFIPFNSDQKQKRIEFLEKMNHINENNETSKGELDKIEQLIEHES